MKTQLTIEESARLIELGVDAKLASKCALYILERNDEPIADWQVWKDEDKYFTDAYDEIEEVELKIVSKDADYDQSLKEDNPIFTLTDLLSILPKEIEVDKMKLSLVIEWQDGKWYACYMGRGRMAGDFSAPELIDALNSLLIWIIKQGYLKTEKK